MKIVTAHAPIKPEEVLYIAATDGTAEVWIRKNVRQEVAHSEIDGGSGGNLEYVYDEVYFRTKASKPDVEADIDRYWLEGQGWIPEVPLTEDQKREQRYAALEKQLVEAKAELERTRTDNDMAIAELTMVMAAMMGGE